MSNTKRFFSVLILSGVALLVISIIVISIAATAQKNKLKTEHGEGMKLEQTYANDQVLQVYVDPETGVNYVYHSDGYTGGMSVRYNDDGTIFVSD